MGAGWREALATYAESQPSFGGMFVDGDSVVVFFTDNLDHHRRATSSLLARHARVVMRQASRTHAGMATVRERVSERLFCHDDPHVTEIGLGLRRDEVAVIVTLYPYSKASGDRAQDLAPPDEIVVAPGAGAPLQAQHLGQHVPTGSPTVHPNRS